MPDFRDFAIEVESPGADEDSATTILGNMLEEVMRRNLDTRNFRMFAPDENASNRLQAVYKASGKRWDARYEPVDENLSVDGRVMEVLSENLCEGWLEGYLLTGRHGFFSCYEAFIHIIDSMFNQHAKWLKACHNAALAQAHRLAQLPAHLARLAAGPQRLLPPGPRLHRPRRQQEGRHRPHLSPARRQHAALRRRSLPSLAQLRQPHHRRQAARSRSGSTSKTLCSHCIAGVGAWEWASNSDDPEVVMACAGDVPTLETMAAVTVLRDWAPDLRVRVVNVVDLFTLETFDQHPHGIEHEAFDRLFTVDKPVIFAFHGYPTVVHKLTYKRHNHAGFHIHGYKEEGTTTTPFDMTVLNELDRYTLALDAAEVRPALSRIASRSSASATPSCMQKHKLYVSEHGEDMPEVRDWKWSPR